MSRDGEVTGSRELTFPARQLSLVPLIVGSEGTLAVVAEAELALVPRPRHRGLLVPHFDSLGAAHRCLARASNSGRRPSS